MTRPYAILCDAEGKPLEASLSIRESESAPGRLKVGFGSPP